MCKVALVLGSVILWKVSNEDYWTKKLLKAVKHGNVYEVDRLVSDEGADPDVRHYLGWTALHVATVNRLPEMVKLLLEKGANPDIGDEFVNIYHTGKNFEVYVLNKSKMASINFDII